MKSSNKKWMWIVLAVVAVAGAWYFFRPNKGETQISQQTMVVKKGELLQRVTIAGVVEAIKSTQVSAPYDGYVQKIFVKIGDKVKTNDPLISISQTLQSTESVYPIRAPFSGTVVQILKTEGQFVRQSTANDYIVRIDDVSRLFVKASVPEIDIVKIKAGQEAIIKASPILDKSYKGEVQDISLAATLQEAYNNRSQAEYLVKLEIMDPDDQLKPGMSTILDIIPAKKTDVLTIPHEYIDKQGEKYFVTLKDGTRREIKVGMQNESIVEAESGVNEGDELKQVDFIELGKGLKGVAPGGSRRRGP
jgi:multidrug efflux pump subunit AcrA (membrane-fusion protein)